MTDGWYSVNVALDAPLAHLLSEHKIFVGMKLCINGAELIGSDQAVSPLEVVIAFTNRSNVLLK